MSNNKARFQAPKNGAKVSTEWTGPHWCPQFSDLKDGERQAQKKHPQSIADSCIRGEMLVVTAWGRKQYAIKVDPAIIADGPTFLLPEHSNLYGRLARVRVGADVYLARGESKKKTSNGFNAFVYEVVCADPLCALEDDRDDALTIEEKNFDDRPGNGSTQAQA